MLTNKCTNKEVMIYLHDESWLNFLIDTHSNMEESEKYYSEQKNQEQRSMFSGPVFLTLTDTS